MACQIESNKPNSSFFKLQQDSYESGAVIQKLLEANKQLTSHVYATLCDLMEENALAVLYWDNKFYVVHRHDGSLLLLETNSGILKEYPEVRWRVFEEEDRDTIYLNDQYFPPNG
ncbi:uncharacterized protein [Miscanthus floridulus]|uniref:uncharacterized protein n=1 Tax=Miscanthus floridulus TaxID=154761 RepID=UPI00345829A8